MKPGIHKRLYTVLSPSTTTSAVRPRPYYTSSTLPLSFFDSPPPGPPSRLPSRIPTEPKHNNTHANPLGLTLSPPSVDQDVPAIQLYSQQYQSLSLPKSSTNSISTTFSTSSSSSHHTPTRIRYQLDVGAYGIPKRCRPCAPPQQKSYSEDSNLAVSIGEDAYFIRDNAIGIADGVGGWARTGPSPYNPLDSSPSALFARRLMHYTSAELSYPPPTLSNRSKESLDELDDFDPASELESHLSELSEGIDVLQILERAYERTVNAHVQPQHNGSIPLHTGSSTALVAVLDHVHMPSVDRGSATASDNHELLNSLDPSATRTSRTTPLSESKNDPEVKLESPTSPVPVVKIANIGDCMGMLVRGEEIVWRSEEMWWAFNTPVQLAPPPRPPSPPPVPSLALSSLLSTTTSLLFSPPRSPSPQARLYSTSPTPRRSPPPPPPLITPRTTAHLITLPVHANDILILASDGLSDNLWDEDILDEVVQFRRTWASSGTAAGVGSETQQTDLDRAAGLIMETSTSSTSPTSATTPAPRPTPTTDAVRRYSIASMLSEALCSRARRVSERRASPGTRKPTPIENAHVRGTDGAGIDHANANARPEVGGVNVEEDEVPFARRAREAGKVFRGGKRDDISVLVAVISPAVTSTTLNLN